MLPREKKNQGEIKNLLSWPFVNKDYLGPGAIRIALLRLHVG